MENLLWGKVTRGYPLCSFHDHLVIILVFAQVERSIASPWRQGKECSSVTASLSQEGVCERERWTSERFELWGLGTRGRQSTLTTILSRGNLSCRKSEIFNDRRLDHLLH